MGRRGGGRTEGEACTVYVFVELVDVVLQLMYTGIGGSQCWVDLRGEDLVRFELGRFVEFCYFVFINGGGGAFVGHVSQRQLGNAMLDLQDNVNVGIAG